MSEYYRQYTGFETLSVEELKVLQSFNQYAEFVLPDRMEGGLKGIAGLVKKGYVKRSRPFKLTSKGKKLAPLIK